MALHFGKFLIAYQLFISIGIVVVHILLIRHSLSPEKKTPENWKQRFTFCLKPNSSISESPNETAQKSFSCPVFYPVCKQQKGSNGENETIISCDFRLPSVLGQGLLVGCLHAGTNIVYLRTANLRPMVKIVSSALLAICTAWDLFCTQMYLGHIKTAMIFHSNFEMDRFELAKEVKRTAVTFVVLHVIEGVLCAYTLIVMLLTSRTYDYAESLNMTWDQVKNMTPWTITKKNLMQDRIARIVRGQITDENGHPITASPKLVKKRWAMIQNQVDGDSSGTTSELHRVASKDDLLRKKEFKRQKSWKNLA